MIGFRPSMLVALSLTACGKQMNAASESAAPAVHVERDQFGTNFEVRAQKDEPVTLTIRCRKGIADNLVIDFDKEPSSPPPLAGVYGSFSVGSLDPRIIEMSYFTGGIWSPRNSGEVDEKFVIARFLEGEVITFQGDGTYMPYEQISWLPPKHLNLPECKPWRPAT